MNNSIGKIINIEENIVTVKVDINILNYGNLMNIHTVFDDGKRKLIGEILKVDIEYLKIAIVGELKDGIFIPGISLKPSFSSIIRIVTKEELSCILGPQDIIDNNQKYIQKDKDYVIIIRKGLKDLSYQDMEKEFLNLMKKIGAKQ